MVKEIAIMRMLQDHPNVVRLFDVYEDHTCYLLVLELCTGGELFDQIIAKVRTSSCFCQLTACLACLQLLHLSKLSPHAPLLCLQLPPQLQQQPAIANPAQPRLGHCV